MTAVNLQSAPDIATALYLRTKTLHTEAERSGVIRDMLRGTASRDGYMLLMRNLLPAYRALENGLERHRCSPALASLAGFGFDRASAIEADLVALCGPGWAQAIASLPEGVAYAAAIDNAASGDGARLIAHAYARYLGDLSGGQILKRLLVRSLRLRAGELTFYDFPLHADLAALKADYRAAIDRAGAAVADRDAVVEEGARAFSLNIALSCAVQARLARTAEAAE